MEAKLENNKRIAKNTIMLYIRMFLTMLVSFYTSRIILEALGVEDFGIYNIVGGVVVFFSFLNNAMASATQRFLNYELGQNDLQNVKKTFSMSLTVHISIAILVFILAETLGLWFLNEYLNIPQNRIYEANWIYQFSILTCCVQIIRIPYHSCIIAYEKMSFYAYIGIIEVLLKLIIVYLLYCFNFDKLVFYGILVFVVTTIISILYKIYCNKMFVVSHYNFFWDTKMYKNLISFSGWSLFGSIANVSVQQGINILLNIFWGVTVNAGLGIANQVTNAIYSFVSNFQIAFNPQIIKSYASGENVYFINLIFKASKYSYFLLFLISMPFLICTDFILDIWLNFVPEYTIYFCRLTIIFMLIDAMAAPLWTSIQATGNIRNYQILMGGMILINLPLIYMVLYYGFPPKSALIVRVVINILTFIIRLVYLKLKIKFPVLLYLQNVICPILIVSFISIPFPVLINQYYTGLTSLLLTTLSFLFLSVLFIIIIGLDKSEKHFVKTMIINRIKG